MTYIGQCNDERERRSFGRQKLGTTTLPEGVEDRFKSDSGKAWFDSKVVHYFVL
jgi:hypothetical protein